MKRAGAAVDNLTYSYAGNHLSTISDASGSNLGVKNGVSSYAYDGNGNMVTDGNRGATLTYNYLNLPKTVKIGANTMTYDYDASGVKHKYVSDTLTLKYAGIFEYRQVGNANQLYRVGLSEGQAVFRNGKLNFEYYLKDHLGNVRVVFDGGGSVLQRTDYYAFGLSINRDGALPKVANWVNRYNFLGKEAQVGSGYVDLAYRFYDASIGRFGQVDPLTEGQDAFSPYHYSFNNPIWFSDPDGRFPECCGGFGDFLTGVGAAVNENMGWSNPIKAQPGYVEAYNAGRTAGHYISIVAGAAEITGGALGIRASVGAEVGSGGLATPAVAVTATGSASLVAHGGNTAMNAVDNLKSDRGRVNANSTENTGRGSNHLKPDPKAQGDHSTFRTDPKTGKTTNTATYTENPRNPKTGFQETKRVDVSGKPHIHSQTKEPIPTPHVIEPKQKNPRPARPDELPRQ